MRPYGTLEPLLLHMQAASQALANARRGLARAARRGGRACFVDPAWEAPSKLVGTRLPGLRPQDPALLGHALSARSPAGSRGDRPCAVVYVEASVGAVPAVPREIGTGSRRLTLDVQRVGAFTPVAPARAGALLERERAAELLTRLEARDHVDWPGLGRLEGWRPLAFPTDQDLAVRYAGPGSGAQDGVIEQPLAALRLPELDAVLLVRGCLPGDPGAPLIDPQGLLLGFFVGRLPRPGHDLLVFLPAARV